MLSPQSMLERRDRERNAGLHFGLSLSIRDVIKDYDHPFSSKSPLSCASCDTTDVKLENCSGCKGIHYCGIRCQTADWHTHKLVCKSFASTAPANRPKPHYVRVLLFEQSASRPRFIWLPKMHSLILNVEAYVALNPYGFPGEMIPFQDSRLRQGLTVQYNWFNAPCLENNKSICALIGGDDSGRCRGNYIITSSAEPGNEDLPDVYSARLAPISDYLKLLAFHSGPKLFEQPQKWYTDEEWRELKAQAADQKNAEKDRIEDVTEGEDEKEKDKMEVN